MQSVDNLLRAYERDVAENDKLLVDLKSAIKKGQRNNAEENNRWKCWKVNKECF